MFYPFRALMMFICVGMTLLLAACPTQSDPDGEEDLKPEAAFNADIMIGSTPLTTQFFDTSFQGSSPILLRHWDFGDGSISEERNPIHTYLKSGTYSVSLTVTSGCGSDKLTRSNYIEVREPQTVQSIGSAGTSANNPLSYNGMTLKVPAGAFESNIVIGVSKDTTTTMPVSSNDLLISSLYKIQLDTSEVRIDPRNPMTLEISFALSSVPTLDRVPSKVQIIALLADGSLVPIPGSIRNDIFSAPLAGLPQTAVYGVLYRPTGNLQSVVAETTKSTASDFTWDANQWRVFYSNTNLQELTALRLGALANLTPFDSRNFTASQLAATLDELVASISTIHETFRDAGLRSPTLLETAAKEYDLIFNNIARVTLLDYNNLSEEVYSSSIFGSIVIDPAQLIAICKANATKNIDQAQKLDLANVFAQELFRSCYRGYAYPEAIQSDLKGFEHSMTIYAGQIMAGLTNARALGDNEIAYLDEPLFNPDSTAHPNCSCSGQDFLFYTHNLLGLTNAPFDYLGNTTNGALELIRISENIPSPTTDPVIPLQAAYAGYSLALRNTGVFPVQEALSSLYGTYVADMAFGNSALSRLRPSDATRVANTFNADRFSSGMVIGETFRNTGVSTEYSTEKTSDALYYTVLPLSTRAFVFTAEDVEANLRISVNPALWTPDAYGHTMTVSVYKEGSSTLQSITSTSQQVTLTGFGSLRGFTRAIVLISNVTLDKTYEFSLTAETLAATAADQFGILQGTITKTDGVTPIQGVNVAVYLRTGSVIGQLLASTTTNVAGAYSFPAICAGEVHIVYTKSGYVTKTADLTVAAAGTTANTTLTAGK